MSLCVIFTLSKYIQNPPFVHNNLKKIGSELNKSSKDNKLNSLYITNGGKNESIKKSGRAIQNSNKVGFEPSAN